ncbi:MAG: Blue-light-activated protein [Fibrobacteres bacterium]|nr:Blue-light-activated protein [Fibrobacterota bacterium]
METILVVEDEENVRRLVRLVLEAQGYRVLDASGAREALYIHENHSAPIDLLLTDIVLSGKSGREVARELQELRPGIRVIFMSGYTDDTVMRSELEKSNALFMAKPFTPTRLLQKVRSALDGVDAAAEIPHYPERWRD